MEVEIYVYIIWPNKNPEFSNHGFQWHTYLKNPPTEAITGFASAFEPTSSQLELSNREAFSQFKLSVPVALNLAYATRDPWLYISIWTCG